MNVTDASQLSRHAPFQVSQSTLALKFFTVSQVCTSSSAFLVEFVISLAFDGLSTLDRSKDSEFSMLSTQ